MDPIGIIGSVSKIAILAFVVTLAVVVYEVFVLMRKNRSKSQGQAAQNVAVPDFDATKVKPETFGEISTPQAAPVLPDDGNPRGKFAVSIIALVLIVLLAGGGIMYYMNKKLPVDTSLFVENEPTQQPVNDELSEQEEEPTASAAPTVLPATPTMQIYPTIDLSADPFEEDTYDDDDMEVEITPTSGQAVITPTTPLITTVLTTSSTKTVTPKSAMPVAASYHIPVALGLLSLVIISLAMLL